MGKAAINRIISFQGYYDTGEELYVSCSQFNGLLKINKKTTEAQFIRTFPNEITTKQVLHQGVYCIEQTLIFVPANAGGIHTYDLQSGQMDYYPIDMPGCKKVRCIDAHLIGDKLWLFYSYADNPIVVFDVKSHEMDYCNDIINILPKGIKERKFAAFWSAFAHNGYEVYAAVWRSPYILHMNLESRKVELISLKGWADKLAGVTYDSGVLYLTEWETEEIKAWKLSDDSKTVFRPMEDMRLNKDYSIIYTNVIACQGQVIAVPNSGTKIYSLRQEDRAITPFCEFPQGYEEFLAERKNWRRHLGFAFTDEGIRLFPCRGNMMLDINVPERTIAGQIFRLGKNWEEECFTNIISPYIREQTKNRNACESRVIELKDFIRYIETM